MASIAVEHITDFRLTVQRVRGSLRRPRAAIVLPLGLALLFAFIYTPPRWQDWNQNSRFNLTRAIVDDGTVRIDRYAGNTGDYAEIDGHIYTDKAPGLSLMAVPVYAVTSALEPYGLGQLSERIGQSGGFADSLNPEGQGLDDERINTAVALYIAVIVTVSLPAVIMLLLLALMIERLTGCRTATILATLAVGLATPVFTYSQAFYGHIPAAACVVGILALIVLNDSERLSASRLVVIGLLAGWAVVIEYPVALILLPIGIWIAYRERERAIVYGVAGMLPPLAVLAVYDLVAFGTILPIGYEHSALWQEQHSTGFMSLTYPRADAIWGLTFSRFRGLFLLAPVMLLSLPGLVIGLRDKELRGLFIAITGSVVAFFLFVSSSIMWWGGFSVGPRYLAPVLPLLALPLGVLIARINSRQPARRLAGLLAVGLLGGVSALLTWSATFAGQNYPPDTVRDPLVDYVLPAMRDGDVARNLGMALQLNGLASLAPLLIVLVACVGVIALRLFARPVVAA